MAKQEDLQIVASSFQFFLEEWDSKYKVLRDGKVCEELS
jgi:hypothetical protein